MTNSPNPPDKSPETLAAQASDLLGEVAEHPMSVPIWQVADYAYDSAGHYADVINERRDGQIYGRYGSPTAQALADLMARLEHAEAAWVFSSGMGAIHATLMTLARSGGRIVSSRALYGGTYGLFTDAAARAGIEVTFFDSSDGHSLPPVLDGASAVFVESVANPTFEIADLETIAGLCAEASVPLVVDNTVPTPALLNPLDLGADLVVHSTSKYVGGHHDLMGGAVAGAKGVIDEVRHLGIVYGTTASAFESWLALRGAATLGVRMQRHCANAIALAQVLDAHPAVERVLYTGLPAHPHHERAAKLMRGFGGMAAVDLGTQENAWAFMDRLQVARVGSSFGGVRSEVTHPATTSHRQFSAQDRAAAGITDGLVRISVGIEDISELSFDFTQALSRA